MKKLFHAITVGLTLSSIPAANAYIADYSGFKPKTANLSMLQINNAMLMGTYGRNNYTLVYQSCDYIIQNYYDRLEACAMDTGCNSFNMSFPGNTQPLFQLYSGGYYGRDSEGMTQSPVRTFMGECLFQRRSDERIGYGHRNTERTEKGWTKITFAPQHSPWNIHGGGFLRTPAQSVVTAEVGMAIVDPSLGIRSVCGYDGLSNSQNGQYRETGYITAANNVVPQQDHVELLDYVIAGQSMKHAMGLVTSDNQFLNIKPFITQTLKGELHSSTPMIVGECNSSCVEPAFEVDIIPNESSFTTTKRLTNQLSSSQGRWAVRKIFTGSPRDLMPDAVVFRNLSKITPSGKNEYGQDIVDANKVLPGGALFGYEKQDFYIR